MQFAIRTARISDEDSVSALLAASYSSLFTGWYDDETLRRALPVITRANPALLNNQTFYVAKTTDGSLIGCGGWTAEQPATGQRRNGVGHIRHFATHPGALRNGIGKAILETCIRDAARNGIIEMTCYSSLPAERFYAALGFVRDRPADIMLQGDIPLPSIIMLRKL